VSGVKRCFLEGNGSRIHGEGRQRPGYYVPATSSFGTDRLSAGHHLSVGHEGLRIARLEVLWIRGLPVLQQ
jgi:hypothetical protein